MEELKEYLLDRISYCSNYNPALVCFGPTRVEIETKRNIYQEVLDKLREIERKGKEEKE